MGLFRKKKEVKPEVKEEPRTIKVIGDPNDPVLQQQIKEINESGNFLPMEIVSEEEFLYSDADKEDEKIK